MSFYCSIAGTILASFPNVANNIEERVISHILIRSLLENYFRLLYIFESRNHSDWSSRYDECLEGFKHQYYKFYSDPHLPYKSQIEQESDKRRLKKIQQHEYDPSEFWRIVTVALNTGLREAKILEIDRTWLRKRDDGWWLILPAGAQPLETDTP